VKITVIITALSVFVIIAV